MKEPACWRTGASQAPPSPVQVYDGSPQLRAVTPSLRLVHHHLHAVELLLLHLHPRVRHRHHVLHQGDQVHHAHVVLQPQRLAQHRLEAESKAIRELPRLHPTWAINTPSCGHNEATSKLLMPMFSSWAELIAFGRKKKKKKSKMPNYAALRQRKDKQRLQPCVHYAYSTFYHIIYCYTKL